MRLVGVFILGGTLIGAVAIVSFLAVERKTPTEVSEVRASKIPASNPQSRLGRQLDKELDRATVAPHPEPLAALEPRPASKQTSEQNVEALPEAWTFLPDAPQGWIRLTPADSPSTLGTGRTKAERKQVGDAHDAEVELAAKRFSTRFPGGYEAFKNHPSYRSMRGYLATQPVGRKFQGPPLNRSAVLYVSEEGRELKVEIEFLAADKSLGDPADPRSWGDGILARMDAMYGFKGVPTRFMGFFGGVSAPETAGITQVDHPQRGTVVHGFNFVLGLTHRTTIKVYGQMSPSAMRLFLSEIETGDLLERAEAMD
ncbi:MAG: hypothetical protein AAGE80_17400 [Pseudomonadota bacterium]